MHDHITKIINSHA